MLGVLFCALFQGFVLAATAFANNALTVLAIAFIYMATVPLVRLNSRFKTINRSHWSVEVYTYCPQVRVCREAIWQCKTPPDMLGRVFSIQKMISQVYQKKNQSLC